MPEIIEGNLDAKGFRFGIVVSRFNSFICDRLLEGALDTLNRHGADIDTTPVVKVPGLSRSRWPRKNGNLRKI